MNEYTREEKISYNEWFISAIKSSRIDGVLQEKNLLQNCIDCINLVKSTIHSKESEPSFIYEEFRLDSTILLLLGCPSIRSLPEISSSEDFIPLIKSIPLIEDSKLFVVLKGLKNYKYLRGILPFLPCSVSTSLLSLFLNQNKSVSSIVLAISFEIFYALIYSLQFEDNEPELVKKSIECFQHFLKSIDAGFDSVQDSKLRAYHFMYSLEVAYLLICLLETIELNEPHTASLGLKFKNLRNRAIRIPLTKLSSFLNTSLNRILSTCNESAISITFNIWISWHSVKPPGFGFSTGTENEEEDESVKSIQSHISYTAFNILKFVNKKNSEISVDWNGCQELVSFLNHVAVDPLHDPDVDLTSLELIQKLKDSKATKTKKLLSILLSRDDIFALSESLQYLKDNIDHVPALLISPLAKKLIDSIKSPDSDDISREWKNVVIKLCKKLARSELLAIIEEKLDRGTCECLKTPDFMSDLTQIFNQLSDHQDSECYDSYVWLCLQSGTEVVSCSVEMALSLPGLVPVVASGLKIIYPICQTKTADGLSLLTSLIKKKLMSNLPDEMEKELFVLITTLLRSDVSSSELSNAPDTDVLPLNVNEAFQELVCPHLQCEADFGPELLSPLSILEVVLEHYPQVVMESSLLSALIISLSLIHHNCCSLTETNFALHLNVRTVVEHSLFMLTNEIKKRGQDFEKEVTIVCVLLNQYDLHPRCVNLLAPLVNPVEGNETFVDEIFELVLQKSLHHQENFKLSKCTRIQWVWALFMILPDCDEEEWLTALHLTRSFLSFEEPGTYSLTSVLKVFQEFFVLLCDSENSDVEDSARKHTAVQYCFKAFSSSAMKFVNYMLRCDETPMFTLINLFSWWCLLLNTFSCSPELPYLFLNVICNSVNDLIESKMVLIKSQKKKRNPKVDCEENLIMEVAANGEPTVLEDGAKSCEKVEHSSSVSASLSCSPIPEEDKREAGIDVKEISSDVELRVKDSCESERFPVDDFPSQSSRSEERERATVLPSKKQVISREKFNALMDAVVKVFVGTLTPNEMASTIAGKLKNLCEL